MKSPEYKYAIAQCDVPLARHSQLESYRAKRHQWLTGLDAEEHHAIWTNLSSMVWTDVSYRTLRQLVIGQEDRNETGCLINTLIAEQIIQGYVADSWTTHPALFPCAASSSTCAATGRSSRARIMSATTGSPTTTPRLW
jgi:hypothetical protein